MIEQKYIELIHADVDGEISDSQREELKRHLATNPDARKMHEDMVQLGAMLDRVSELDPPADLASKIVESTGQDAARQRTAPRSQRKVKQVPYALAASVAVAAVLYFALTQMPPMDDSDVTGTIGRGRPAVLEHASRVDGFGLDLGDLSGSVDLHRTDQRFVVEVNISSAEPLEIVASYDNETLRLAGFASWDEQGSVDFSASDGQFDVTSDSGYRIAAGFRGEGGSPIDFRFYAAGNLVYEYQLSVPARSD